MRFVLIAMLAACGGTAEEPEFQPQPDDEYRITWDCLEGCSVPAPMFSIYTHGTLRPSGMLTLEPKPCGTCQPPAVAYEIAGPCVTGEGFQADTGAVSEPWAACVVEGFELLRGEVIYGAAVWEISLGLMPGEGQSDD